MSEYAPHQQRVIDEKADLDANLAVLSQFIDANLLFQTCSDAEKGRLAEQRDSMSRYSRILGDRIAAF